jgi:nuclear transport factor 2 (NTF2) superfamily protein
MNPNTKPKSPGSKSNKELGYRLMKELWAFTDNRISVRFEYEWHDATGQWWGWLCQPIAVCNQRVQASHRSNKRFTNGVSRVRLYASAAFLIASACVG